MTITILHGEDIVSSKNKLEELKVKARGKEKIQLDGEKIDKVDLIEALETQSLFTLDRLIIIENLLTSRPSKKRDELIKYLANGKFNTDIILWNEKDVTPSVLKKFSATFLQFKPSGNIFKFVESIRPKGFTMSLPLFHDLAKTEPVEVIFVMIVRQLRYLLLTKDKIASQKSGLPPWQVARFERQANYFREEDLIASYRKLLDIDYKIKSGRTPFNLQQLLDIFLVNL